MAKTRRRSTVGQVAGGGAADHDPGAGGRALQRVLEGGLADRLDHHVDAFGQPRAGFERGGAQRGDPVPLGGVAAGRVHPLAERRGQHDRRRGHPAAGALDQHRLRLRDPAAGR